MAGFITRKEPLEKVPMVARISNFEDRGLLLPKHQDSFLINTIQAPDEEYLYLTSGAVLNSWEKRVAEKRNRRIATTPGYDLNRVVRLMVSLQRVVNMRDATVGRDAMVVSLPDFASRAGNRCG